MSTPKRSSNDSSSVRERSAMRTLSSSANCVRMPPADLLVDPDASVSRSSRTTSVTPSSVRCHATLAPTAPPPTTTTSALSAATGRRLTAVAEPRAVAPRIDAGYGVPRDGSGAEQLPWRTSVERLEQARSYWICTTRADGRPHAAPVWGLWLDDALWFSTGRRSLKARNLARDPSVVVHLESAEEVVILEGEAQEERDARALERFRDAYEPKYGLRPDLDALDALVLVLRPRAA